MHTSTQHSIVSLNIPLEGEFRLPKAVPPVVKYDDPVQGPRSPWPYEEIQASFQDSNVEAAWEAWTRAFHQVLVQSHVNPAGKPPGEIVFREKPRRCRVTQQGVETPKVQQLVKLARQIRTWHCSGSDELARQIDEQLKGSDPELLSSWRTHTQEAAQQIRSKATKCQQSTIQNRVKKWRKTLSTQMEQPTSALYRWLKDESPAGPVILNQGGKQLHTWDEIFGGHRTFWESICAHPSPEEEKSAVSTYINADAPEEILTRGQVLGAVRSQKAKSAGGLDSWDPAVLKQVREAEADSLADMYNLILRTKRWPAVLTKARVSLIPKPGAPAESPASWRPITITSVFYRIFAKICLFSAIGKVLQMLPSSMLGGLPSRTTPAAILRVYLDIESVIRQGRGCVLGVSLDAAKCFDRISVLDAVRAGEWCGIPRRFLQAIAAFYAQHQRHTSVRKHIDPQPWSLSRGLIQGCAASVLLTCCLLSTWHERIPKGVGTYSFIDDRLLFGQEARLVEEAWICSEAWNEQHGWAINPSKTVQFEVGAQLPTLMSHDEPIKRGKDFTWLGHQLMTGYNLPREVWKKRFDKAWAALVRLQQLQVAPVTKQRAVERAVSPLYAYGMHHCLPAQASLKQLSSETRASVWGRKRKVYHSWDMAKAILYRTHAIDPWSAVTYQHLMFVITGLQHREVKQSFYETHVMPERHRSRGPCQLFNQLLEQLACQHSREGILFPGMENPIPFEEKAKLGHHLRACLRDRLVNSACRKRKNLALEGFRPNLEVTQKLYRRRFVQDRSGLVALLTDGVITAERSVHMNSGSKQCPFCQAEVEDVEHVLWKCPKWTQYRKLSPEVQTAVAALPPAARRCGVGCLGMSQLLCSSWDKIQKQCAKIIVAHQAATCGPQKQNCLRGGAPNTGPERMIGGHPVPPFATLQEWIQGRPLEMQGQCNLSTSKHPWIYSKEQFNKLQHWATTLRVGQPDRPPVSVLEMYVSYLLQNGQYRFASEWPDTQRGGWWTQQLAAFVKGVRSLQHVSLETALIPEQDQAADRPPWTKCWHVPPQVVSSLKGLMLYRHSEVRAFLANWEQETTDLSEVTHGAEEWRRYSLGIANSQMSAQGTLSAVSLLWHIPVPYNRRSKDKKSVPPWVQQNHDVARYREQLVRVGGLDDSQLALCKVEGVYNNDSLCRLAGRLTKRGKSIAAWMQHNGNAKSERCHLAAPLASRVQCPSCKMPSSISHISGWLAKECSHAHSGGRVRLVGTLQEEWKTLHVKATRDAAALRAAAAALP